MELHWIRPADALPTEDKNVLIILRRDVAPDDEEAEERWMEWGTFAPGQGWSGPWEDYLGSKMIVTHWALRPEFPED